MTDSNPTIRSLLVASARPELRLGEGWQGVVYNFADPAFRDVVLKRNRLVADLPGQDENSFRQQLEHTTALTAAPNALPQRNYGQPIMWGPSQNFSLLVRQHGVPLESFVRDQFGHGDAKSHYLPYLRWLVDTVPDEALTDLYNAVRYAQSCGKSVDHLKKDNLFWDAASNRFALIDLFDRIDPAVFMAEGHPIKAVERSLQIAGAAILGVTDGQTSTAQEVQKLLVFTPAHYVVMGRAVPFFTLAENKEVQALEQQLLTRIERLAKGVPELETDALPKNQVAGVQIDDIGLARASDLRGALDAIKESYGLSGR